MNLLLSYFSSKRVENTSYCPSVLLALATTIKKTLNFLLPKNWLSSTFSALLPILFLVRDKTRGILAQSLVKKQTEKS